MQFPRSIFESDEVSICTWDGSVLITLIRGTYRLKFSMVFHNPTLTIFRPRKTKQSTEVEFGKVYCRMGW